MYLPTISQGRVSARYQLGQYLLVFYTDCVSIGAIDYLYVMVVLSSNQKQPIYAIASEISVFMTDQSPNERFLGSFPGNGHMNHGMSADWTDLDKFTARALAMAAGHLQTSDTPIKLPPDPKLN